MCERERATIETLRKSLANHIHESQRRSHDLGGEMAKRWHELDITTRRSLARHLAREHRFTRWALKRYHDEQFLADWSGRINRSSDEDQRRRDADLQRPTRQNAEIQFMRDGLFTRDVQ